MQKEIDFDTKIYPTAPVDKSCLGDFYITEYEGEIICRYNNTALQ